MTSPEVSSRDEDFVKVGCVVKGGYVTYSAEGDVKGVDERDDVRWTLLDESSFRQLSSSSAGWILRAVVRWFVGVIMTIADCFVGVPP